MPDERERMTWDELGAGTPALAEQIADDGYDHVAEIRAAVLYEKPWSTFSCDYVWRRTDQWIGFPWSTQAPVGAVS